MKKVCKRCGKELPIESFGQYSLSKDGHRAYCKDCWAEMSKIQYYNRRTLLTINKVEKVDSKIKNVF